MLPLIFWASVAFIAYTYAGYPLLLGAFARLRRPVTSYEPATPSVTLLITAYNEEQIIATKIENSLALDYPADAYEILVATDGSTDATPDIVRRYALQGVRLSHRPERCGKTAAINHAMQHARGDIVVFSDANNLYEAGTLRAVVAPFADPSIGAACGNKYIVPDDDTLAESEGLYWKYEGWIKRQETRLGSTVAVLGEIFAIRRSLFETAPENIINDDFYMATRILRRGHRVVHVPEAVSAEHVSPTAADEVIRRTRMVAGMYQTIAHAPAVMPWRRPVVCWQLVSHKFMRPLVPLWMIAALVSNVALVVTHGGRPWVELLIVQGAFYVVALLGRQTARHGVLAKVLYLPTFLVNSNVAALHGLFRFTTGQQTTQWTRLRRRL